MKTALPMSLVYQKLLFPMEHLLIMAMAQSPFKQAVAEAVRAAREAGAAARADESGAALNARVAWRAETLAERAAIFEQREAWRAGKAAARQAVLHGKHEETCRTIATELAALAARLRERSDGRPPIGRAGAVAEEGHPDGLYRRGLQPAVVRVALVPG